MGGSHQNHSLAGLEFASFVKLLLFVAEVALNKAAAFAEQYASPEVRSDTQTRPLGAGVHWRCTNVGVATGYWLLLQSRVDFVLVKLGLGDPTRFQHVRRALLQTHAADI